MILTISDNYKEKRVMPTDALMGYYIQAKINMNPCIMKKNTQHDIYTYTFMMEAKKKKIYFKNQSNRLQSYTSSIQVIQHSCITIIQHQVNNTHSCT